MRWGAPEIGERFLLQEGVEKCDDHGLSLVSLLPDGGCPVRGDGTFDSSGFGDGGVDVFFIHRSAYAAVFVMCRSRSINAGIFVLECVFLWFLCSMHIDVVY